MIVEVRKLAALQPSFRSRSIANVRSDALTGVPSEYFSPLRIVNVYVLPPSETTGAACATDGMIWVPAVPVACANEYGPRCVSQCTSPPWVVKSIDGSSDCGNVPSTTVAVPPVLPPELPPDDDVDDAPADDDVELDPELPHAATANAMTTATAAQSGLLYFRMRPPPRGLSVRNLNDRRTRVGSACPA